jgi:hypothetical protein
MKRLPQGSSASPGFWLSIINKIITRDEVTGQVEDFSPPEKYKNVPPKQNPYSNLQKFVICWLDNLLVATGCEGTCQEQLEFHAIVLSHLLAKLAFFDFKLLLKKEERRK